MDAAANTEQWVGFRAVQAPQHVGMQAIQRGDERCHPVFSSQLGRSTQLVKPHTVFLDLQADPANIPMDIQSPLTGERNPHNACGGSPLVPVAEDVRHVQVVWDVVELGVFGLSL